MQRFPDLVEERLRVPGEVCFEFGGGLEVFRGKGEALPLRNGEVPFSGGRRLGNLLLLKQKAVAAQSFQLSIDGCRRDTEVSGDLSVGHAAAGLGHQLWEDVRAFEPVVWGEGLTTEGASAG